MRSGFGRLAVELRLARGMSQKEFSEQSGMSLSRISNLEYQRSSVSDDVVNLYVSILNCTGPEAFELRKRASFSNEVRSLPNVSPEISPLQAMLNQFGDKVSPQARKKIRDILEQETGESLDALCFSSNAMSKSLKVMERPSLPLARFVEIALFAERVRGRLCDENAYLDIGMALEKLAILEKDFDYKIEEKLNPQFEGAFAYIVGHSKGHTVVLEEERILSAFKGVYFARHVVAHEIAHHFLHAAHLSSDKEVFFKPQELARNSSFDMEKPTKVEQVVNTIEEVEAECFGTFLLVPWASFYKGTADHYLSKDFGEQPQEVRRYARLLRQPAVKDGFRARLWQEGRRKHLIFDDT